MVGKAFEHKDGGLYTVLQEILVDAVNGEFGKVKCVWYCEKGRELDGEVWIRTVSHFNNSFKEIIDG
jgi:hypothetical protein